MLNENSAQSNCQFNSNHLGPVDLTISLTLQVIEIMCQFNKVAYS